MAKKNDDGDPMRHPDGHTLINGARWHYPKTGEPSVCAILGCDRVLTRHMKKDLVEDMEPADPAIDTVLESVPVATIEQDLEPLAAAG